MSRRLLVDKELVLTVRGGVISVSKPEPASGSMASDGKATLSVDDHSDTSSSVTLTGVFQSTAYGSSGAGRWVEHHADGTCVGTWSVSKF